MASGNIRQKNSTVKNNHYHSETDFDLAANKTDFVWIFTTITSPALEKRDNKYIHGVHPSHSNVGGRQWTINYLYDSMTQTKIPIPLRKQQAHTFNN